MNTVKTFKIGINSTRKLPQLTNVGYICPNGNINFQTNEAAVTYAKNSIIAALKCKKPFERAIVLSDNTILGEYDGNSDTVTITINIRKVKKHLHNKISVYHGHTDNTETEGVTNPISFDDYRFMKYEKVDEVVAINSKGEFSKLKNTHKPIWLSSQKWFIDKVILSCFKNYIERVASKHAQTTPQGKQAIHEFWKWAATKLRYGIEYSTNFSHLKNI